MARSIKKPTIDTKAALGFAESNSKPKRRATPKKAPKAATKATQAVSKSGRVPTGDVRLTANIRDDLHMKLKIAAATRRTTIGDLVEDLIENHL